MGRPWVRRKKDGAKRLDRKTGRASAGAASSAEFRPPDGGWGWLVALGSFIEMFLTMGTLLCCGVYFTPVQVEFDISSAELGWIISSGSTLLSATCPIGSACVKRFGCRTTSLIGGLAVSCGFVCSSFAQSSIQIFITLGLVAGIGSGLVFVSAAVILGHYFKRRYAIVNGLAFSGPGVAIFVLPPLLDLLIETYGWRGSLMIQGAIAFHAVAAAALFRPLPSEPRYSSVSRGASKISSRIEMDEMEKEFQERMEQGEDENGNSVDMEDTDATTLENEKGDPTKKSSESLSSCLNVLLTREDVTGTKQASTDSTDDKDTDETLDQSEVEGRSDIPDQSKRGRRFSLDRLSFKNNCWLLYVAAFVLICPVSFFQACAFYSVTFHVVARTSLVGVSANMAGMSLSALGAGSSFTRLTHGWFIHRGLISATTTYIVALVVGALGAFGNAVAGSYVGVVVSCLVVGFSSGSVYPLVPVVLRDLVSLRGLPTTYGLAMFFDSCGVFAGGFTAGLLRDYTGAYTASFCMTGIYYTLAALFLLLVIVITRMNRASDQSDADASERLERGDYQKV